MKFEHVIIARFKEVYGNLQCYSISFCICVCLSTV
jgi:hypothetical protein